ncbi:Hypothetical protein EHI5A_277670 [Entamoeba histolytica KU27]|uniref:Uncharacterized protein n=1 Tax=Entamoeba histolytica KU27 TaxID=885311 RepID=M2S3C0_ENTHI|nr:Hypothetical protein EHI5A_277670 [Entamoeba histolytica KU27]
MDTVNEKIHNEYSKRNKNNDVYTIICDNITNVSCDKFKIIKALLKSTDYITFNLIINEYGQKYSIVDLLNSYDFYKHRSDPRNWFTFLIYECGYALAIITRIKRDGVTNLSPTDLDRVIPYLDDFWARDGLAGAWDIVFELYRRQNGEL